MMAKWSLCVQVQSTSENWLLDRQRQDCCLHACGYRESSVWPTLAAEFQLTMGNFTALIQGRSFSNENHMCVLAWLSESWHVCILFNFTLHLFLPLSLRCCLYPKTLQWTQIGNKNWYFVTVLETTGLRSIFKCHLLHIQQGNGNSPSSSQPAVSPSSSLLLSSSLASKLWSFFSRGKVMDFAI